MGSKNDLALYHKVVAAVLKTSLIMFYAVKLWICVATGHFVKNHDKNKKQNCSALFSCFNKKSFNTRKKTSHIFVFIKLWDLNSIL